MSLMTVRGARPFINMRAGSEGQLVVPATDEQPTPSAESSQRQVLIGIPVANPVFIE
jgi:hypothetical protein